MAHPLYERIRAEVLAEHALASHQSEDEVLASLEAKFEALIEYEMGRAHEEERQRQLAGSDEDAPTGLGTETGTH